MSLAAGTRLGPYEVLGLIGAGGMGEVYKARDTRLDRTVAIKILPNERSADPDPSTGSGSSRAKSRDERRARFGREAHAVAALSHPHICTPHDVDMQASTAFVVTQLLKGAAPRGTSSSVGSRRRLMLTRGR
jgi:serine/threonine protein kinase